MSVPSRKSGDRILVSRPILPSTFTYDFWALQVTMEHPRNDT